MINSDIGLSIPIGELLNDVSPSLEIDAPDVLRQGQKDLFAVTKRKAWNNSGLARADLTTKHIALRRHNGLWVITIWQKAVKGQLLTEIKADRDMVPVMAAACADLLKELLNQPHPDAWCVATTPARRHKEWNFAIAVAANIAEKLNLPFVNPVADAKNHKRFDGKYWLVNLPSQPNIILFDDIVTTGGTISNVARLLLDKGKTVLPICGINNN